MANASKQPKGGKKSINVPKGAKNSLLQGYVKKGAK